MSTVVSFIYKVLLSRSFCDWHLIMFLRGHVLISQQLGGTAWSQFAGAYAYWETIAYNPTYTRAIDVVLGFVDFETNNPTSNRPLQSTLAFPCSTRVRHNVSNLVRSCYWSRISLDASCNTFAAIPFDELLSRLLTVSGLNGKLSRPVCVSLDGTNVGELFLVALRGRRAGKFRQYPLDGCEATMSRHLVDRVQALRQNHFHCRSSSGVCLLDDPDHHTLQHVVTSFDTSDLLRGFETCGSDPYAFLRDSLSEHASVMCTSVTSNQTRPTSPSDPSFVERFQTCG